MLFIKQYTRKLQPVNLSFCAVTQRFDTSCCLWLCCDFLNFKLHLCLHPVHYFQTSGAGCLTQTRKENSENTHPNRPFYRVRSLGSEHMPPRQALALLASVSQVQPCSISSEQKTHPYRKLLYTLQPPPYPCTAG